jgi:iron complex transport system permease protein
MIRWTMGGLSTLGLKDAAGTFAVTLLGAVWLVPLLPQLNLFQLGDDWAQSRGVHVLGLGAAIMLAVALWTGSIVAVAGPISFIGLIAPHMARRLMGDDLRRAAPAALVIGASLLAFCDAAARVILMPAEVPVGVLTALLGGPAFLALLLWRRR